MQIFLVGGPYDGADTPFIPTHQRGQELHLPVNACLLRRLTKDDLGPMRAVKTVAVYTLQFRSDNSPYYAFLKSRRIKAEEIDYCRRWVAAQLNAKTKDDSHA